MFDLPSLLMELAKIVWAEHTKGPGRQQGGETGHLATELIKMFKNQQQPSLRLQDKTDGQLNLYSWKCTISGCIFTETKNLISSA